ncbi:MAG: hypothetical protein DIU70_007520 [Bacillota bacterium]
MALEGSIDADDRVFESGGARVVMDGWTAQFLEDAVLEYDDGPWGGFRLVGGPPASSC